MRRFVHWYIHDWYHKDRHFIKGLADSSRSARLASLRRAAADYRVVRNFPTKTIVETERLGAALDLLEAIPAARVRTNPIEAVFGLAEGFRERYGQRAVSAASKFLWFRHQSPVVIFDKRAVEGLRSLCGLTGRQAADYENFCFHWRQQFDNRKGQMDAACEELVQLRDHDLCGVMEDELLDQLVSEPWFRERVFDKFLWWYTEQTA